MAGTAIITGGGGGIAKALAHRLAAKGYSLVLADLDQARLDDVAATLPQGAETVVADLTHADSLETLAQRVESRGDLALLVNNAGIIRPGNILDLSFAEMERHVAIMLLAPMRLTKAAAKVMAANGSGCILSIVSAAGLVALPGSAAYSAAKFGLRGFLTAASLELAQRGVKIRNVFPGAVDTPMLRYEATHGGSPLNFLNKDVLTADQVADACLRAMDGNRLETYLPFSDGLTSRLVCAMPGLMPKLLPLLEKQGRSGMQRFLASRNLTPEASRG